MSQVSDVYAADAPEEVVVVARGIASAVAPTEGLTDTQALLLGSVAYALTGTDVDYRSLEPLAPSDLADALSSKDDAYRHRIVQHMVLGELVLRPIPTEVAWRVQQYAESLGVKDEFVRVARRYAQGAYGLAWMDLQRNGFADHVRFSDIDGPSAPERSPRPAFEPNVVDAQLEETWRSFAEFDEGTLGHGVHTMYFERDFNFPGAPGGAPRYLAQHDFVHVLADYGTNLQGELEVFALIARADPDPKGFAWLATLFGLFETGYIVDTGFFQKDRDGGHFADRPGMHRRIADAIRRGKEICRANELDLFEVDYYDLATLSVEEVRERLAIPPKADEALESGSAGTFELEGMSETQRVHVLAHRGETG